MSTEEHRSDVDPLGRLARLAVPWVGLIIVVTLTCSFIGAYRHAVESGGGGGDATGTPDASGTIDATGSSGDVGATDPAAGSATAAAAYVLVLADGLNLRALPMTSASVVKQLAKDTRLTLLEKGSGWYRVMDPEGAQGWVAAGGRYTELVEP